MYENGEIHDVMERFEYTLKTSSVYVSGTPDRAERVEIEKENGRLSRQYVNQNYYNNGQITSFLLCICTVTALAKHWDVLRNKKR